MSDTFLFILLNKEVFLYKDPFHLREALENLNDCCTFFYHWKVYPKN